MADTSELSPTDFSANGPLKIGIVDSEPCFTFALKSYFELGSEPFQVVASVLSPTGAFDLITNHSPDLLLLEFESDWPLVRATMEKVRDVYPEVGLILTARSLSRGQFKEVVRLGVAGCLSKQMEVADFVSALKLTRTGAVIISPNLSSTFSSRDVPEEMLTEADGRLLGLIVVGLGNQELAKTLFVSEPTVKRHIQKLLAKLNVDNRVQAAVTAVRQRLL